MIHNKNKGRQRLRTHRVMPLAGSLGGMHYTSPRPRPGWSIPQQPAIPPPPTNHIGDRNYQFYFSCNHPTVSGRDTGSRLVLRWFGADGVPFQTDNLATGAGSGPNILHCDPSNQSYDYSMAWTSTDLAYVELEIYGSNAFLLNWAALAELEHGYRTVTYSYGVNVNDWEPYSNWFWCLSEDENDWAGEPNRLGDTCGMRFRFYFREHNNQWRMDGHSEWE